MMRSGDAVCRAGEVLRWTSRVLGFFLVLLTLTVFFGQNPPLTFGFVVSHCYLLFLVAGYVLAWRHSIAGGAIIGAGMVMFFAREVALRQSLPGGWVFYAILLLAVMFITSGLLMKRRFACD